MNHRALLLAGLAAASPVAAETLKAVPAALDPAKAYILVEYRQPLNNFRGFPGSKKYLPLVGGLSFARYDETLGDIRGMGKAAANPVSRGTAIESFRNREIAKADGARLMLIEVDPDLWVIQGYGTTSFSLGSYSFRLEPGTVTDLGVVTGETDWAEGDGPQRTGDLFKTALLGPFAKRPAIAPARAVFRERTATDIPIPAALAAAGVRPVHFATGAKFGNYMGGLVNRIDGVNASAKTPSP